ncbi:transcription factor Adf-1-like [Cydia fagiglandana]|uniref:transcription factor Adf-1-like n=1 Tax=Cydia fagiglandana TaxID=1458189 RepID=UPI0021411185
MNELDLIKEVEKRPILYDKSVSGFNKTKLRDDAWKEVQEALNVSAEAECKKRWRSLRDSFIKLQRTHGGRTRWPYHQAMRFLLPHLDPAHSSSSKKEEDSDTEEERRPQQSLPDLSFQDKFEYDEEQPAPKKARLNSSEEEPQRTDPDELFLFSCAPILKRLNSKQNAAARLKILQVLYEAEFGCQVEMPYVTTTENGLGIIDGVE